MTIGDPGNTPAATRNVPPYLTLLVFATSSMIYPVMASTHPTAMTGPRARILSEKAEVSRTRIADTTFGGTVKSWAVVDVYPNPLMIVGRKSE